MKLEEVGLEVLGSAGKVIATKEDSTIIKGAGSAAAVKERIALINSQAEIATNDYERGELNKRAAALSGKVAVIKVGGATETEIDEKKFRVDDAVAATKAALSEGIVPGGGVTLLNLASELKGDDPATKIVKNALRAPMTHILENAGLNSQALIAEVEKSKPGYGINVMEPEKGLVDMKKAGVIDPARVTREAVQNAISIAATSITMGALIVEVPEAKSDDAAAAGGMY
jgi:chaperonin GroEL